MFTIQTLVDGEVLLLECLIFKKVKQHSSKAASNDYDRREALKYGVDSGDKRFKGLDASSGFDSMEALVNTDRAINKYGYNELGHKNMSSDADFAAVSNSLFNKSRSNFAEQQSASAMDNDTANTFQQVTRKKGPVTFSKEYAQSRAGEDAYKDFTAGGGYSSLMRGEQGAAESFRQQRTDNVKEYMKPDPVSQAGEGLDEQGDFRMKREFTNQRKAGQVFNTQMG